MPVKPIPDGYRTITPFLAVEGAAKVIDFLKQAFEARECFRMNQPNGKVGHAELQIGDSRVMLTDASDRAPAKTATLYLYVQDVDATYRRAVDAGGQSLSEPTDAFYGDRCAAVKDSAGNTWHIATHVEDVSPDELKRRAQAAMKG